MNLNNAGLGALFILEELGKLKSESEDNKKNADNFIDYWLKAQNQRDELQKELDNLSLPKKSTIKEL